MKALVATRLTQGARRSDGTDCVDGELVWMVDACEYSRRQVDGPCLCGRAFSGLHSDGYTTTAMVRELAGFTERDFESALRSCFAEKGWCACCLTMSVEEHAAKMLSLAAQWSVNTIVERRLDVVQLRRVVPIAGGK
ncbi:hypothetical protein [Salinibacterium sp. ZJ450]|uniref:DUF7715 family protein n=1 Tax=Salinibacterium sp. ZJ450 TaxID=2708338 RepID=UPI0014246552|nr:hypothetical protein [Salinibacterium sp. ZJ450]